MFYLQYLYAELRRRPGRTALTALGLAVGVGLVVIVGALSAGLDDAQDDVLEPLTGVGTDLSVSRPIAVPAGDGSASGSPFGQLSPRELRELDGVGDASGSLTLRALLVEGEVPAGEVVDPHGPGAGIEFSDRNVSGVDVRKPNLAPVTPDQIATGSFFADRPREARGEAVVDLAFARQDGIAVGDEVSVSGAEFKVVGLAAAPLGGDASDVYLELGRLQELGDRAGRVNRVQVRATSSEAVARLAGRIEGQIDGAEVVTAADLADRVGGSLADADNLSSKLGTALAIVALLAAFLIATLLTLSSVQKRTRELGTLKAL